MEIPIDPSAKALIFDCDGTLVDTIPHHREAIREILSDLGFQFPEDFIKKQSGIPMTIIAEMLNNEYGFNLNIEEFSKLKDQRAGEKIALYAKPIEPVVRIVHLYHGRLPMAVASGGIRRNVLNALAIAGIEEKFETILTAEDPVEHKPNPGIFLEAARRLGIMPQYCQVFEDAESGIIAAQAAGMIVTDVRPYL